jgi:hypothetical protein
VNKAQIIEQLQLQLPKGTVLSTPRGSKSTIMPYQNNALSHSKKGNSPYHISFDDFFNTYAHFKSGTVSSIDLQDFMPDTFKSGSGFKGHGCNCAVFFIALNCLDLASVILTKGTAGHPYKVEIY